MEELINILEEIVPGVDYENTTTLIDDHILDSFASVLLPALLLFSIVASKTNVSLDRKSVV